MQDRELTDAFGARLNLTLLRYPIWPIAMQINPPLQSNNIFVLDEGNKIVAILCNMDKLKDFCTLHMQPVKTNHDAKGMLIAFRKTTLAFIPYDGKKQEGKSA